MSWTDEILRVLSDGPHTISEIRTELGGVSKGMISTRLQRLRKWGRVEEAGYTDYLGGGIEKLWRRT